jgi:outer membrane immunogenic protein
MTKENHDSIWRFASSDIACLALGIILGALAAFAPINARAADLPSAKVAPAPLVVPATSWTGLYFGVSGGYAFDSSPIMNLEAYNSGVGTTFQPYAYASGASAALNNRAFIFSPNIGANYQAGSWVLGAEASADLPVGGDEKSVTFATPAILAGFPAVAQIGSGWSFRLDGTGKVGWLVTPTLQAYVGGGPSMLKTNSSVYAGSPYNVASGFGTQGPTFMGWHAKGGVEWMAAPGWSVKLEYDHADWGSHTVAGAGLLYGATPAWFAAQQSQFMGTKRFTEESVRVGLTYHTNFLGGNNGLFFVPTGNIAADVATFNQTVQSGAANINDVIHNALPAGALSSAAAKAGL